MPELCLSFLPKTSAEIENALKLSAEADLLEIRLDKFPQADLQWIRNQTHSKKIIITLRTRKEGGFWEGTDAEIISLYQQAIDIAADYVDIEFSLAEKVLPRLQLNAATRLILSHHTGECNFDELQNLWQRMLKIPAAVYKLIFTAGHLNDNLTALKMMDFARSRKKRFVIHAMGEDGRISRFFGALRGNQWTYVAADANSVTAPGQIGLFEAVHYFYLKEKNQNTKLVGLVGFPVSQSKGWRLHNELFHRKKCNFLYLNFSVPELQNFWQNWQGNIDALSVTIPHKESVVSFLDYRSEEVELSGICNTLIKKEGQWYGFNTDLLAMHDLLFPYRNSLRGRGALVIGTGATTRSALAALRKLDISPLFITGRNHKKGEQLSQKFAAEFIPVENLNRVKPAAIVQTTPVGMHPATEEMPPGAELFDKDVVVLDVIHNPPQTIFLKLAEKKGCRIISGQQMFRMQAARQFEIFTGTTVREEEITAVWKELKL